MFPLIKVTDTFAIPTYILVLSLTYCVALVWADRRATQMKWSRNMALDIALAIMIGGFVGARLFHVFYEYPEMYVQNPAEIFKFWNGGFVFYGGFLGAGIAAYALIRWRRQSFLRWADFYAPVLALGYALGRIGCFLNGCCYGALCEWPWAVEFNFPGLPAGQRHPTQLYATFYELIVLGLLLFIERRRRAAATSALMSASVSPGQLFFTWLALHAIGRLVMEYFRDDYRGPAFGLSVSSWISVVILVASIAGLFLQGRRSWQAP